MNIQLTKEQVEAERAKVLERLSVCADVTAHLTAAKTNLAAAKTANPLQAVALIADALASFMATQQIQLDQNRMENERVLEQIETALKVAVSPILQPAPGGGFINRR